MFPEKYDIIKVMNIREKGEEIFSWGVAQRTDDAVSAWKNHSRGAAKVAEEIAKRCGMDADRAYVSGLLHDIGRYKGPHTGMEHVVDGYNLLMDKGLPEVARICLTHSFNPREKVHEISIINLEQDKFLKDYMSKVEFDDYDRLIQLADFMSGAHGITTIERRFCSVLWRHGLKTPQEDLLTLYGLKDYFSKKAGVDVYEIFRDELAESVFRGTPGKYNNQKSDEEDA